MTTENFSLTSDAEVEERVRTLTGYEDTSKELPSADFSDDQNSNEGVLGAAKSKIYTDLETTDWYANHHLGEALAYTAAIIAKERLENYTVDQWTIGSGAESVVVRGADQDSGQILSWVQSVERAVAKSDQSDGASRPRLTFKPNW